MTGERTVWLIEDNDVYRLAVARAITTVPGLSCPFQFRSCEEGLAALEHNSPPDVLLLDVGLPGMNGIEGIKAFRTVAPSMLIVILTVFEDDEKIFQAVCAGASGYLLKVSPLEQIVEAINDVCQGGSPMNSRIARRVLQKFSEISLPKSDYGLTAREREILEFLVNGFLKKEIARTLELSIHTVDSHLRHIYEKLHVNSRSSAVARALKERLI